MNSNSDDRCTLAPSTCTHLYKSVRPESLAQGSNAVVADAGAEIPDEHMEHQEADGENEHVMNGESESTNGSDEETESAPGEADAEAHEPECDARRAREHDDEAAQGSAQGPVLGEEEVSPPQVATQPRLPSKDELDVHEAMGHAQFRNWCEPCVFGQGREDLHLRGEKWRPPPPCGELRLCLLE